MFKVTIPKLAFNKLVGRILIGETTDWTLAHTMSQASADWLQERIDMVDPEDNLIRSYYPNDRVEINNA